MERWWAPEFTDPDYKGDCESKEGDVFAFAMVGVEVFTGRVPFEGLEHSVAAVRFFSGHRPDISEENTPGVGLTQGMVKLLQECWDGKPNQRPPIESVVRRLDLDRHNLVSQPF